MTMWEKYDLGNKICSILRDVKPSIEDHHFEAPFLTAYQVAILFKERFPSDFDAMGLEVGGKGTGVHVFLAQYFARELSRHDRNKTLPVEGAFLGRHHVHTIAYADGDDIVESSLGDSADLSMFRIRQES
ncbi:MAG: hypothetical protein LBU75_12340 [Desulfovibrio sp.]|jgi:hypothetical protein|nr:hypothetical protein [Desulfovibrio sp.]